MLTGETENVTNARASQLEVSESERERLIKRTTHFYPPKEGKKTAQVPLCFFVALPLSDKKNSLWLRGPPAGYRLEERPSDIMAGFQFGGQKKLSIFHCQGVALTAVCSVRTDGTYLFFAKMQLLGFSHALAVSQPPTVRGLPLRGAKWLRCMISVLIGRCVLNRYICRVQSRILFDFFFFAISSL